MKWIYGAWLCMVGLVVAAKPPHIEFAYVPPYGSAEELTGRVTNVNVSAYGVAVYIFVGGWWTKPNFAQPLAALQPDGSWSCDITTGGSDAYATQLAAYLVPINYAPPLAEGWRQLPDGLALNAVASIRAVRPYTKRLWFSGYEWSIKDSRGVRTGPGDNYFSESTSNVWVDAQGRLHLKICKRAGLWSCAEVVSVRSFGYGSYRTFLESSGDALDTHAVLGLFTWNDDAPYAHREIDVEVSRWGNGTESNNAQYVIQPWDTAGNLTRYRIPPSVTNATHSFTWLPNRVDFATHAGSFAPAPATNKVLSAWTFMGSGVPQAGNENFRMNLWLCNTAGTTDGADEEVVISRFAFIPSPLPQPVWTNAFWASPDSIAFSARVEPQVTYQVDTSTNLLSWSTRATLLTTNNALSFIETTKPAPPRRFYRLSAPDQ